ncbi:hypothetical protein [Haloarcula sp. Atlit-7R]|uniref:hypothetical protein n=1 Tax=Haloarcula sp. Atlit-7R TaxID=2282125 RepID=UPI000EF137B2|nr:hypothetical protein [Haloarcula sp. Atlit-7R]RLM94276.1 hypothetical protein D3D01_15540 [Haloarcula sp. Atlit-7R]
MRDHYEAAGKVASAAIANGDTIVHSYDTSSNELGHFGLHIESRNTTVRVDADPAAEYLSGSAVTRLTNKDGFSPRNLPKAKAAREVIIEDRDLRDFDGDIHVLEYQDGNDSTEIFDGIRVVCPIYAYNPGFGLQEYREVINNLVFRGRETFDIVADELDIDLTGEKPIEPESDEGSSRTFY